jgi:hypothetical protein
VFARSVGTFIFKHCFSYVFLFWVRLRTLGSFAEIPENGCNVSGAKSTIVRGSPLMAKVRQPEMTRSIDEISLGFSSEPCSCFVLHDLRLIGQRFVTIAEGLSDPWEQGPESNRRNAFVA